MNQCLQCCHSTSVKMTGSSGAERSRCLKTSVYISISYNKLQSKFKNWHWGFPLDLPSPLYVFSRSHVHLETWNMNFLQMFPWSNMDMKPNNYLWVARGILFQKPRHDHTIKGFQSTHYLQRTFGTFLVLSGPHTRHVGLCETSCCWLPTQIALSQWAAAWSNRRRGVPWREPRDPDLQWLVCTTLGKLYYLRLIYPHVSHLICEDARGTVYNTYKHKL